MTVVIKKFIIVNNNGMVRITDHVNEVKTNATKSINGAGGPVINDSVNGKKIDPTKQT
ncbi:hypothetical protein [Ectobacillus polymachus]|uniref:hypothetical protein n=1 Tax=Ectobacillus polymachus TaxID=1508806 RepID=UPI003A87751C